MWRTAHTANALPSTTTAIPSMHQIALLKLEVCPLFEVLLSVGDTDAGWHRALPDPVHVNRGYLSRGNPRYLTDGARETPTAHWRMLAG